MRKFSGCFWLAGAFILILLISCGGRAVIGANDDFQSTVTIRPDVKEIVAEVKKLNQNPSNKKLEDTASKIFHLMVRRHPNPEVRQLEKILKERKLILLFNATDYAQFGELPGKEGNLPVLAVDPNILLNLKLETEILDFMVALDHEMVHFRQWLARGPAEHEAFRFFERFIGLVKFSPAACRDILDFEKEAYSRSCALINAWQYASSIDNGMCKLVFIGSDEFERRFNEQFLESYGKLAECQGVWKESSKF